VAVKLSQTFGKGAKLWFITKVCLDAFTRHIAYTMLWAFILWFLTNNMDFK
jgi:hypothetical protein